MDKDRKIAIIGAGASGLAAAYFLKKKGYSHITLFEKSDRVGGCCQTAVWEGRPYELGASYVPQTHTEVRKICKSLGIKLVKDLQFTHKKSFAKEIQRLEKRFNYKHSNFKLLIHSIRYLLTAIKFSFQKQKHGYQYSSYKEVSQPLVSFLKEKNMEALIPLFYLTIEPLGYGPLDQQPLLYALSAMKIGNCLNSLQVFFEKPKVKPLLVDGKRSVGGSLMDSMFVSPAR
jgi:phytoene dehydrogenase-like protein